MDTREHHKHTQHVPDAQHPRRVELILEQVDRLPTLSPVATRVMSIGSGENFNLNEVVTLLESDPAMTARILGLCRRADKGLGDRITTVRRAILMLGIEAVQSAVLSVGVYELMDRQAVTAEQSAVEDPSGNRIRFDRAGFWRHSIGVACASELLAGSSPEMRVAPGEAFVAGLLHDLGKMVLDLVLPRSFGRVLALAEQRHSDAAPVARSIVGLDHHTAGRRVAGHWRLPEALQEVMWLHSQPHTAVPEGEHKGLIGVVTTARALCRRLHIGWSGDFGDPPRPEDLALEVGMKPSVVGEVIPKLHEAVSVRCGAIGLDEPSSPDLLLQSVANANERLSRLNQLLEHRTAASEAQRRILHALGHFHRRTRGGGSVVGVFKEVVRSASMAMGEGYYGLLYQPPAVEHTREPWRIYRFSNSAELLGSDLIEAPGERGSLAGLVEAGELTVGAIGLLPWLSDYLGDAADMRKVRLTPLQVPTQATSEPAAVLLHERDPAADGLDSGLLEPLLAGWSASIAAAAAQERAHRLGERLAEANRSLAEAQATLTERESMARLGEMTAGAAHEMNNPLTVICGRSQLLASRLADGPDRVAAETITRAAQSLSDMLTSLHLLADPPRPELAETPWDSLWSRAMELTAERCGGSDRLRVRSGERVGPLWIDRELMARALAELLVNALEADSEQIVRIAVQTDTLDGRLLLTVEDEGPGMSPKALKHAFDPFFSEKPAGRQPGLGLSRARRIVELHGGEIRLESEAGRGTCATIALDPAPARAGRTEAQATEFGRVA